MLNWDSKRAEDWKIRGIFARHFVGMVAKTLRVFLSLASLELWLRICEAFWVYYYIIYRVIKLLLRINMIIRNEEKRIIKRFIK